VAAELDRSTALAKDRYMAKPRTDAPDEGRAKELRKIADNLRTLADKIETDQRRRETSSAQRRKRRRNIRRHRPYHTASGLLMDTLVLGGPEDESLRRVLFSWREKPAARWQCFEHVCRAWRPLLEGRIVPSISDLLACAAALRRIAVGVSSQPPPKGTQKRAPRAIKPNHLTAADRVRKENGDALRENGDALRGLN
jgi:hypothetical protein